MRGAQYFRGLLVVGLILFSAKAGLAQESSEKPSKALVVNGKTMDAQVAQINGRSYVDIETLAQLTNGTVAVEPNRIVLTIPAPAAGAAAPAASRRSNSIDRLNPGECWRFASPAQPRITSKRSSFHEQRQRQTGLFCPAEIGPLAQRKCAGRQSHRRLHQKEA